jgi:hypothetical protein
MDMGNKAVNFVFLGRVHGDAYVDQHIPMFGFKVSLVVVVEPCPGCLPACSSMASSLGRRCVKPEGGLGGVGGMALSVTRSVRVQQDRRCLNPWLEALLTVVARAATHSKAYSSTSLHLRAIATPLGTRFHVDQAPRMLQCMSWLA